ncbi:MAG: 5-methyltetrahydropteroyltriglutamate--homocysteine S-methyltransferase [Pseudomonadota bacterium]
MKIHNLGYPRIGGQRELKFALEAYWSGSQSLEELQAQAAEIRYQNYQTQIAAGVQWLPVNDFALYDQILNMSTLLGVIPSRFRQDNYTLDISFRMARGRAPSDDQPCCGGHSQSAASKADYACDMKKWFDTNYHYIVPEFEADTTFTITDTRLFDEVSEALIVAKDGDEVNIKPVLIGPLTYLYLGQNKSRTGSRLDLLDELLESYVGVLQRLAQQGVEWVQIDEPILVLELEQEWQQAFTKVYEKLSSVGVNCLLTTYFESLGSNLAIVKELAVQGLHIDGLRGASQVHQVIDSWPSEKVLSLGLVDGRNIWQTDYQQALLKALPAHEKFAENLWLTTSCSLLHVPVDLNIEKGLDVELKSYLAFARQKLDEIADLAEILLGGKDADTILAANSKNIQSRKESTAIHNSKVQQRLNKLAEIELNRHQKYADRIQLQTAKFKLPLFPTTSIGSFPQTSDIRQTRRDFKQGRLSASDYQRRMEAEIEFVVRKQESLDMDVLVHGEPERNDMVEYFGEQLNGYAFTQLGWVQSYGSRCVKPPIIYGDVSREGPMTVTWSAYAQSLTDKIMKGMLSGPVTMLQWSFVRDDQPRSETCQQIALALRDEVLDLEAAGINLIQIDEAALREGLPLKKSGWQEYLNWAVDAFRLTTSGVADTTQVHTHMCYSEFNDIIEAVAKMDADVITIETSKSQMKLLQAFVDYEYPNQIGPGVYDIHSPNIPEVAQMVELIEKAAENIPADRLWVNPDCGLKTRGWQETEPALRNMVAAAKQLRERWRMKTSA